MNGHLGTPVHLVLTYALSLAGIPFVAEGKVKVDVTNSHQFTWGTEESISHTYTANFPVKAGPHQTVHAVSTVKRGEISVPYTITLACKETGAETQTKGTWRGVSTWNLHHEINVV